MQRHSEINALTKECIVTALLRMIEEKDYDSISITDITNLAGVSRMAYYRNYKSKDDILLTHLEDEENKLISEISDESNITVKGIINHIARFFQENSNVVKAVYSVGLSYKLTGMLEKKLFNIFPDAGTVTFGKYAVPYYVGAVMSVFHRWIECGMIESVDEISEVLYKLVNYSDIVHSTIESENK